MCHVSAGGRELPSPLERLLHRLNYEPTSSTVPEAFLVGQAVWIRKFPSGRTWMAGTITRRLGPRSWMIDTDQGQTRRHMEHIRPRSSTPPRRTTTTPSPVWDLAMEPCEVSITPQGPATAPTQPTGPSCSTQPIIRTSTRVRRPPERFGFSAK